MKKVFYFSGYFFGSIFLGYIIGELQGNGSYSVFLKNSEFSGKIYSFFALKNSYNWFKVKKKEDWERNSAAETKWGMDPKVLKEKLGNR